MTLRSFALSRMGRAHKDNKDSYLADDSRGLYIVSDGVGTRRPSEVASRLAVESAAAAVRGPIPKTEQDARNWLGAAVRKANEAILARARSAPEIQGASATLTLLVLSGTEYALAHAGDSRGYLLSGGGILQLTSDHTVVFDLFKSGVLTKDQTRSHPDRHLLTRALGTGDFVVPEIILGQARPEDRFLLCSDGVTKELDDAEIAGAASPPAGIEEACRRLVELAYERGGKDDITAILVEVG